MSPAPWAGRRLHFVGIGGAGMSGLALIAAKLGADVSGSDRATSAYMEPLRALGIDPVVGHAAANVPAGAEVVYSSAVAADNPERSGSAVQLHRSELLAEIAGLKRCIAVSGTHGKTTTTGMIAHVLRGCGLDPAYVVGGALRDTGLNADWGTGDWIVIEADESDRSLLNYAPEIAVLTNAELDHHSTYASRLDLDETFARFTSGAATAVVWDRPELLRIAAGARELGARRVIAVFQPHLYSRTRALAQDFGAALATADVGAVVDVYPAREQAETFPGVTGRLIAQAAADAGDGRQVAWLPGLDDARHWLSETLRPGDLCLVMGAGDIDSLGRALVKTHAVLEV